MLCDISNEILSLTATGNQPAFLKMTTDEKKQKKNNIHHPILILHLLDLLDYVVQAIFIAICICLIEYDYLNVIFEPLLKFPAHITCGPKCPGRHVSTDK